MATPETVLVKTEIDFDFGVIQNFTAENSQTLQTSTLGAAPPTRFFPVPSKQHSIPQEQPQQQQQQQYAAKSAVNESEESDDVKLQKLLKKFDLELLYGTLKLGCITYRSLPYLSTDDIQSVLHHVGYRAEFREKLFAWRQEKLNDVVPPERIGGITQIAPTTSAPAARQTATTAPVCTTSALVVSKPKLTVTNTPTTNTIAVVNANPPSAIVQPERRMAATEDFLSLIPGVSGTATRINNTPTVVLEHNGNIEEALSFMPTSTAMTVVTSSVAAPPPSVLTTNEEQPTTSAAAAAAVPSASNNTALNERRVLMKMMNASWNKTPKGAPLMSCAKVNVYNILEGTHIGRTIRQFYAKNAYLENGQRNEIVRLIIEEVMQQGMSLNPRDCRAILNDIIAIFPAEKAAEDYYFIYRNGRGNPLGRLYQRYSNENSKRRKLTRLVDEDIGSDGDHTNGAMLDEDDSLSTFPQELPGNVPNVDEMTALALKQLLTTDHFSWEEVCDKWIQTWALRQKELQQSNLAELLTHWVKLSDPRAAELYNIDFHHVFPGKENCLFAKWDEFVQKITPQFDKKLNHDEVKRQYKLCKLGVATKDEKDFAYAIGLAALLPSTARFRDQTGKLRIRASISDSIDSFVMRLNSLEAYESQLDSYTRKFGPVNRTTQPFLVVISPNGEKIGKIYVALENRFYCMKSFLHALDLCYKIYHTCGLKYPTMCENIWTFLQLYFYDMNVSWAARNVNLVALLVSLSTHI